MDLKPLDGYEDLCTYKYTYSRKTALDCWECVKSGGYLAVVVNRGRFLECLALCVEVLDGLALNFSLRTKWKCSGQISRFWLSQLSRGCGRPSPLLQINYEPIVERNSSSDNILSRTHHIDVEPA